MQTLTPNGVRWEIGPEWTAVLLGPEGLRLEEWLRSGQAQVVKKGEHRVVYRVDLPGRSLFVKHYRCRGWRAAGRNLIRRSASRREFQRALEVLRRQVPTAAPVGIGEERRGGLVRDSYYVTEAIPNTCTLDQFLAQRLTAMPAGEAGRARQQVLLQLARLCALLHRNGVEHMDFHAGNILVRYPADVHDPRPCLYLIDLPKVRLSGPLSWRRSRRSLAMLLCGLLTRSTLRERWQFWRVYLRERPDLPPGDARQRAVEVLHRAWRTARRVMAGRDRRCLADNREFQTLRGAGGRLHAVRALPRAFLEDLLQDPERPIREFFSNVQKLSHSSIVVRARFPLAEGTIDAAYKQCRTKSWWKAICAFVRPSRALLAWRVGQGLFQRGIPTPRPLLVCQHRFAREGYLATEWIPGENLHLYLWRLAALPPAQRHKLAARCAESLGRLVARLHTWEISHRDLKACNLLVHERGEATDCYLADLDGVRFRRRLSAARRAQDLARLAASLRMHPWVGRTLYLRFLKAFVRTLEPAAEPWRQLWQDVARRTELLLLEFHRQGKPVA